MELKIKGVADTSKTRNSYEVVIETMEGDADSFEFLTFGPFLKRQDEAALESLLETVLCMESKCGTFGRGFERLEEIKFGDLWLTSNEILDEEDYVEWVEGQGQDLEDMPYSAYQAASVFAEKFATNEWSWHHDYPNSYRSHNVYYYDENLEQHDVEVTGVKLYKMEYSLY